MAYDIPVTVMQQTLPNSFTIGNTTVAKILVPQTPGYVMAAVTGETALPTGESTVRQRVFQGGCRIVDMVAASTDAATNSLQIVKGLLMSSFSAVTASGAMPVYTGFTSGTITGTNVINRTAGSFITDGWQVGDTAMIFGDTVQTANNGIMVQVTGVAALTLTMNGTSLTNNAGIAAGFQVYKIGKSATFSITAGAGNTSSNANVPLMGSNQSVDKTWDSTGISLGANQILIGNLTANASALPARVDVNCEVVYF